MHVLMIYSSRTGNTKQIAEVIENTLKAKRASVKQVHQESTDLNERQINDLIKSADVVGLGYWADKGTANTTISELANLETLKDKPIFIFGTIGSDPESEHGKACYTSVNEAFNASKLLGQCLCRGKIDPRITERMKKSQAHPHAMDEKRIQRHQESMQHPDAKDIENARAFSEELMIRYEENSNIR